MQFKKPIATVIVLFAIFLFLEGCGDKKNKYQHPAVRTGKVK